MTLQEAIDLIRPGVTHRSGTWADIGAGTGLFTQALLEILEEGKVIALDKSPHGLYQLANQQLAISKMPNAISGSAGNTPPEGIENAGNKPLKVILEIIEADFNQPLDLPTLDGIIMANALHYANDHVDVLKNASTSLKPGGTFILIEYDTEKSNPPWVPNPVSLKRFHDLCKLVSLKEPVEIGRRKSIYQDGEMYVATTAVHRNHS